MRDPNPAPVSQNRPPVPDDVAGVLDTAQALASTEVKVFRAAHLAWFGARIERAELRRAFTRYRRDGVAPFWVRYFVRRTLQTHVRHDGSEHPRRVPLPPWRRVRRLLARGRELIARARGEPRRR